MPNTLPHAADTTRVSRRQCIASLLAAVCADRLASRLVFGDEGAEGVTFSFGTYGMPLMKTEDAVRLIADAGYDGIEIAARSDWDAAPDKMPADRRQATRKLLDDSGLKLTALMEHLFPTDDHEQHAAGLERLKRVAQLGHDLYPSTPPPIQTVLGGGNWEDRKGMFVDRLGDWANVAKQQQTVIAIKPHRGGAMSRPREAVWLIQQLNDTPWIRMVYDYSHYALRDMPLEETITTALPYTAHIAIKDTIKTDTGFRFLLPGESQTFDYAKLFRLFYAGGYRGDICCEVSGMVSAQAGYDPRQASETCYANIAPLFEAAGVPRRG